jgi:hypothetical protein
VLGGEILQDGGASGIADEFTHHGSVPFSPPSPDNFADQVNETASVLVARPRVS